MSDQVFYITTALSYVNDVPHVGHAYECIAADVQARYRRACGQKVFFVTGTDEHGMKIEKAAKDKGYASPKALADEVVKAFQSLWAKLDISNDDFIRTTEPRHAKAVQKFFAAVDKAGYLEKRSYKGWYCVHEENFWPENQLIQPGNLCPDCKRPTQQNEEVNYFFKQSAFRQRILDRLKATPEVVEPASRRNELLGSYLEPEGGVQDLSITRATLKWGIPTPSDPDQVVYVWFDALIGYLTAAGYGTDEARFNEIWPASVHLIGKDILRFHAVLWPSMLMAAGIPLPQKVFGHGWVLNDGQKMSKSLGNAVNPVEWVDKHGPDVLRYYLLREGVFGNDVTISGEGFEKRYNTELANDLGNLLHRTLTMLEKYFGGRVPEAGGGQGKDALVLAGQAAWKKYSSAMESMAYGQALEDVFGLVRQANQYVDEQAPWKLAKDPAKKEQLATCLYNLAETLRLAALGLKAFMPSTAPRILAQLGLTDSGEPLEKAMAWGGLKAGTQVSKGQPLFPKEEETVKV
jgi:methionyl-tRNA synthetase